MVESDYLLVRFVTEELLQAICPIVGGHWTLRELCEGDIVALYDAQKIKHAASLVRTGWAEIRLSVKGKTRYRLTDLLRSEVEIFHSDFLEEIQIAASSLLVKPERLMSRIEFIIQNHNQSGHGEFETCLTTVEKLGSKELKTLRSRLLVRPWRADHHDKNALELRGLYRRVTVMGRPTLVPTARLLAAYFKADALLEPKRIKKADSKERAAKRSRERYAERRSKMPPRQKVVRSPSIWNGLLPADVARQQIKYEAASLVRRMSAAGFSRAEIAARLAVSTTTVDTRMKYAASRRQSRQPVEQYLAVQNARELVSLADVINALAQGNHEKRDG